MKLRDSFTKVVLNHYLQENKARGREGTHPLVLDECLDIAQKVLASNQITHFRNFFAGMHDHF